MLRDQALLPEDMQGQTLLHWAQVWVRNPASLCPREKTKKLPGQSEQEVVGGPEGLEKLLTLQPHPWPRHSSSGPHVSFSVRETSLSTGSGLKIQIPHCHQLYQASSVSSPSFFPPNTNSPPPPKPTPSRKPFQIALNSEAPQALLPDWASKCSQ